jgi:hypothetical protein
VAFGPDFQGFRSWSKTTIESAAAGGATHVAGNRTVYVNELPPPGATEFPVGTMMVKVTETDGKIFARAKRGGTFNAKWVPGWEWFELVETKAGDVAIRWRGLGPPAGETYGGDPNAGCNMCHKLAVANDYVLAPGIVLTPAPDGGAEAATQDPTADASADATEDATEDATNDATDGGTPDATAD